MNKKALHPVVSVGLFLVITIVSIVAFSNWFNNFESSILSKVELQSEGKVGTSGIDNLIDDTIYFKNSKNTNLTITAIKINSVDCTFSPSEIANGLTAITLSNCDELTSTSNPEILVITDEGIFVKEYYLEESLSLSTSLEGPVYTDTFISVWNTSETGTSANNQISLPIYNGGTYNFTVDWGDGNITNVTSYTQATHTYVSEGIYNVSITGEIVGFRFNGAGDVLKLIEIQAWGPLNVGNNNAYFFGAQNLIYTGSDDLNLTGTNDLTGMFAQAFNFNGDISRWDVSDVTDMAYMFAFSYDFNQSLNNWDVSKVQEMDAMFYHASNFNQNINNWDVSSVTNMSQMFEWSSNFNQSLNNWDVSSVLDMNYIFKTTQFFNQNLSSWNVSSVTSCTDFDLNAIDWTDNSMKPNFTNCIP